MLTMMAENPGGVWFLVFQCAPKETGQASHPETLKLAALSSKNEVRNFWRSVDIPVVSWYLAGGFCHNPHLFKSFL